MVFMSFSQKWAKMAYEDRIRKLWQKVIIAPTPDLWVKVFFYRDKAIWYTLFDESEKQKARQYFKDLKGVHIQHISHNYCRGHYRSAIYGGHGFYKKEWNFIHKHPKIRHCITLKYPEGSTDDSIVQLMAHEYRHYRQYKKYGTMAMNYKMNGSGKRPIQHEKDARLWAEKRTKQLGYKCW